jgi:hypothetical protein
MILGITPNITPRLQSKNNQPNYMAKTNYKALGADTVSFGMKVPLEAKTRNILNLLETRLLAAIRRNQALIEANRTSLEDQLSPTKLEIPRIPLILSNRRQHKTDESLITCASKIASGGIDSDFMLTETSNITHNENVFNVFLTTASDDGYITLEGSTVEALNEAVQRIASRLCL